MSWFTKIWSIDGGIFMIGNLMSFELLDENCEWPSIFILKVEGWASLASTNNNVLKLHWLLLHKEILYLLISSFTISRFRAVT